VRSLLKIKKDKQKQKNMIEDKAPGSSSSLNYTQGWAETYDEVEVDLCRPHPLVVGMRFEYDSKVLEENIKQNGQLDPCRAVRDEEDGVHLLIYVGQRRLNAIKTLKQKFENPSTIKVIIDEDDIDDKELVKRAVAEGIDERGQRVSPSDLERISYCRNLLNKYDPQETQKILTNAGLDRPTASKNISMVERLNQRMLERLHKIEQRANFRFRFAHLDALILCEDEENFYETAALAAFTKKPPEEIRTLRVGARYLAKEILWFKELFPEYTGQKNETGDIGNAQAGDESQPVNRHEGKEEAEQCSNNSDQNSDDGLLVGSLPESVFVVQCLYCGAPNPFKISAEQQEFIFCTPNESGVIEKLALGAESIFDCQRECSACANPFWITASVPEGGKTMIKTSKSKIIELPKGEALSGKMYWDRAQKWMLYNETTKKSLPLNNTTSLINTDR
jgi:hypothetical protein